MEKNRVGPFDTSIKLLHHFDKVSEFLTSGFTTPVMWELDLTYSCNHNCIGCYDFGAGGRISDGIQSLDLNTAKNYVDQIYDLGAKSICLTGGGEPLLFKDLIDIIVYIKNKGLEISLTTNGSKLNKENIPVILNNCTWVRISLDAGTDETFKKIHRSNDFNLVIDNIKEIVKTSKEINSKCTIGVGFLTCNDNIHDMITATDLCKSMGVDYIQFRSFHLNYDYPYPIEECRLLQDDNFKVYCLEYKYDKHQKEYEKCYAQHFSGVISLHKVFICCHFRNIKEYEIGDLRKKSLNDIWNSENRLNLIKRLDLKKCITGCRLDSVNIVLSTLVENKKIHKNFI